METSGLLYAPAALTPWKNITVPIEWEAAVGGVGLDVLEKRKISSLYRESNHDSCVFQAAVSHFAHRATAVPTQDSTNSIL